MDLLTEFDRTIELLDQCEIDKVRFKLAKLRVAIQKLISDDSDTRAALRKAQDDLQAANTRRIQTSQALSALTDQSAERQ